VVERKKKMRLEVSSAIKEKKEARDPNKNACLF
jgi:hypothetical protein